MIARSSASSTEAKSENRKPKFERKQDRDEFVLVGSN